VGADAEVPLAGICAGAASNRRPYRDTTLQRSPFRRITRTFATQWPNPSPEDGIREFSLNSNLPLSKIWPIARQTIISLSFNPKIDCHILVIELLPIRHKRGHAAELQNSLATGANHEYAAVGNRTRLCSFEIG